MSARRVKRVKKGSFLVDTLLGVLILSMGILPLAYSLTFAYGVLLSSVEKRARLDEIYSTTERDMVNFAINRGNFMTSFDKLATTQPAIPGGYKGGTITTAVTPRLRYKDVSFDVRGRGKSFLKVHAIRKN